MVFEAIGMLVRQLQSVPRQSLPELQIQSIAVLTTLMDATLVAAAEQPDAGAVRPLLAADADVRTSRPNKPHNKSRITGVQS